jgi:hypothetical protein
MKRRDFVAGLMIASAMRHAVVAAAGKDETHHFGSLLDQGQQYEDWQDLVLPRLFRGVEPAISKAEPDRSHNTRRVICNRERSS